MQKVRKVNRLWGARAFSTEPRSVKGMKDLHGENLQRFKFLSRTAEKIFRRFNYSEVIPNIVEHEEIFKRTLGETSEIITKEMYSFKDLSGNTLVLRPEGTAGVMRMILEKNLDMSLPQKLYYMGPMFRYERPQKGRQRQFYQIGLENIGNADFLADIEIIYMAYQFIRSINSKLKIKVEINTLGDSESRERYNKELTKFYTREDNFAQLSDLSKKRLQNKNPLRIFDSKDTGDIAVSQTAPRLMEYLSKGRLEEYDNVKAGLKQLGVPLVENPRLVRGLDYYCGICFEIKEAKEEEKMMDTLVGGGRYDYLANYLGRRAERGLPGIGWAAGSERIADLIDTELMQKAQPKRLKLALVPLESKDISADLLNKIKHTLFATLASLDGGEELASELVHHKKNADKIFEYLDKNNFDVAVVMGADELEKGLLSVKDLHKRETVQIKSEGLVEHINKYYKVNVREN